MKNSVLILTGLTIGLLSLVSCQKDEYENISGPPGSSVAEDNASIEKPGKEGKGAVYTMDNGVSGNHIIVYNRDKNGMLTPGGTFPTGGSGTGLGLGSQGSLILDKDYLFACNAGSNEISVFKMSGSGLNLIDKVSSHGTMPISVTTHGNLLYVLNAGGSGNISGFKIMHNHHLSFINNSDKPLSSGSAGPAQIQFDKSGKQLIVTEKLTNNIVIYDVDHTGAASNGIIHPSVGATPFGFDISRNNTLIITDAFGGSSGASAVTSYSLKNNGSLNLITGPVATNQTAACWLVITKDGRYCYATNTGSDNITGYKIDHSGAVTLLDPSGITAPSDDVPIDVAMSKNSGYLYVLNSGDHTITMYEAKKDGSLSPLGNVGGLPIGTVGLAAE